MKRLQGGTVVNVEGETPADVLIKDGAIEAVSASLTVRKSEWLQLESVSYAHASALTNLIPACHRGCELVDIVSPSCFRLRKGFTVLYLCLHAS